jgi:hypothetical protein
MFEEQETDPQESDDNHPPSSRQGKGKDLPMKPPLNPNRRSSAPGALSLPSQSKGKKMTTPPRANALPSAVNGKKTSSNTSSPFDAGRLSIIGGNENPLLPTPKGSPLATSEIPFESDSPDFDDHGGGDGGGGYDDDEQLVDTPYDYEENQPLPSLHLSPTDDTRTTSKRGQPGKTSPTLRFEPIGQAKKHVRHSIIPESDEEQEEEPEEEEAEAFQSPTRGKNRRISFASTIMDTPGSDEFPVGRQVDDDSYSEAEDG